MLCRPWQVRGVQHISTQRVTGARGLLPTIFAWGEPKLRAVGHEVSAWTQTSWL